MQSLGEIAVEFYLIENVRDDPGHASTLDRSLPSQSLEQALLKKGLSVKVLSHTVKYLF